MAELSAGVSSKATVGTVSVGKGTIANPQNQDINLSSGGAISDQDREIQKAYEAGLAGNTYNIDTRVFGTDVARRANDAFRAGQLAANTQLPAPRPVTNTQNQNTASPVPLNNAGNPMTPAQQRLQADRIAGRVAGRVADRQAGTTTPTSVQGGLGRPPPTIVGAPPGGQGAGGPGQTTTAPKPVVPAANPRRPKTTSAPTPTITGAPPSSGAGGPGRFTENVPTITGSPPSSGRGGPGQRVRSGTGPATTQPTKTVVPDVPKHLTFRNVVGLSLPPPTTGQIVGRVVRDAGVGLGQGRRASTRNAINFTNALGGAQNQDSAINRTIPSVARSAASLGASRVRNGGRGSSGSGRNRGGSSGRRRR